MYSSIKETFCSLHPWSRPDPWVQGSPPEGKPSSGVFHLGACPGSETPHPGTTDPPSGGKLASALSESVSFCYSVRFDLRWNRSVSGGPGKELTSSDPPPPRSPGRRSKGVWSSIFRSSARMGRIRGSGWRRGIQTLGVSVIHTLGICLSFLLNFAFGFTLKPHHTSVLSLPQCWIFLFNIKYLSL